MIKEIDTAGYDSMDKSGVMLVEFYSKTCGPCKMLSFVLKDIDKNDPDFRIFTVDFDANQGTLRRKRLSHHALHEGRRGSLPPRRPEAEARHRSGNRKAQSLTQHSTRGTLKGVQP